MKEHGYSTEAAQAVWDILVPFSGYAFNKAHSAAYGLISYWTAYLKTHYPVEFMAALLQNERTNKDKTAIYLGEARRMGIKILPPDVNESVGAYSAVGDVVRFGLGAIRNVGDKAVAEIIKERQGTHGKFVNFIDFIRRVPISVLNKRTVEALIKGGAFDGIDPNRHALYLIHESAVDQFIPLRRKEAEGQFDLFADADPDDKADALGDATISVPDIEEWDKKTKLNFEREMLGLYVSDHPLSGMASILAGLRDVSIAQLIDKAPQMGERTTITLAGMITNVDKKISKNGNPWAIVTVEDLESSIQALFFGKNYQQYAEELKLDTVVRITGQPDVREESVSLRASGLEVAQVEAADERPLVITVPIPALVKPKVEQLVTILKTFPGYCQVKLHVSRPDGSVVELLCGDGFRISRDTSLFAEIKTVFGPSCMEETK
jgi:DNA polymerase-3 subunit alpha